MRGIKQNKKKTLLLLGIVVLIAGLIFLPPVVFNPMGQISAGFMMDGEKIDTNPFLAFVSPEGVEVDEVWIEVTWAVQGEAVDWSTFTIVGTYGIKLWYTPSDPIVLEEHSINLAGEYRALTNPKIEWSYDLATLLEGQPHTDPNDPNYWLLIFYADFTMTVASEDTGELLYDSWDGETSMLRVNWHDPAMFSGTGSVSTGIW